MNLFIKNMMCVRCIMAVRVVLESSGIPYNNIEIGRAELAIVLTQDQHKALDTALRAYELEILINRKEILVERIKILLVEMIRSASNEAPIKFTAYLSKALDYDYTYLSNIFSEVEGGTIERFYIKNRIERVKELMVYEEMSIKEIAYQLNYSSVAHLCLQFKKVTGQTPSVFKNLCQSPEFRWKN